MVIGGSHLWIEGFTFLPGQEDESGIDVKYTNNIGQEDIVIINNTISMVADGISYPNRNCDIYANDIRKVTDDGIETDFGYANVRVWNNKMYNTQENGISFQPQYSSPWYFIGNEFITGHDTIKTNIPDRFFFAHNTIIGWNRLQGYAQSFMNSISRNNLWISIQDSSSSMIPIWNADENSEKVGENANSGTAIRKGFFTATWRTDVDFDGFNIKENNDNDGFYW